MHLHDPAARPARTLDLALPVHPEAPDRLVGALGLPRARALLDWARAGLLATPGYVVTGFDWHCPADAVPAALSALADLGIPAERTASGILLHEGGLAPANLLPGSPEPAEADVEILASGPAILDGWLADKLMPVRWHTIQTTLRPERPIAASHAGIFFHPDGRVSGARWAEPHLGVGDTDDTTTSAAVVAMLERVSAPAGAAWSTIIAESCDNLPLIGPKPGAPRTILAVGFGIAGATYGEAAAAAIVAGLLGRAGAEVPPCVRASRMAG